MMKQAKQCKVNISRSEASFEGGWGPSPPKEKKKERKERKKEKRKKRKKEEKRKKGTMNITPNYYI